MGKTLGRITKSIPGNKKNKKRAPVRPDQHPRTTAVEIAVDKPWNQVAQLLSSANEWRKYAHLRTSGGPVPSPGGPPSLPRFGSPPAGDGHARTISDQ